MATKKTVKPKIEKKVFDYASKLISVHDGDTITVQIDMGFHLYMEIEIRLDGLDCPELETPEGKICRDKTTKWLEGKTINLKSVKYEKYGRRLGIITDEFGMTLNAFLLENGFAIPYDGGTKKEFTKEQINKIINSK